MPNEKKEYRAKKKQIKKDYEEEKRQIKERYKKLEEDLINFSTVIKCDLMRFIGIVSSALPTHQFPENLQDRVDKMFSILRPDYQISEENPRNLVELDEQNKSILSQAKAECQEKLSEAETAKEEKCSVAKNRYSQFKAKAEPAEPTVPQQILPPTR